MKQFSTEAPSLAEKGYLSVSFDHQTIGCAKQETKLEALGVMLGKFELYTVLFTEFFTTLYI